jgi:tRNA G18 (ribose-2'-O)-methylase SpoU
MEFVSDVKSPPGLVIICKRNQQTATESPTANPLILVLHGQQLPQNMGGMIRTAEGAGVTSIWVTQNTVDPLSAKSIRASSGSVFRMSLRRQKDLSDYVHALKKEKILVVAADQDGDIDYDGFDWSQPVALIMGAEGAGFADKEKEMFDRLVRIPMAGRLESLNVGVAAAICLFEAARQRRAKGKKS